MKKFLVLALAAGMPFFAFAQRGSDPDAIDLFDRATTILNYLIQIGIVLAIVFFIYSVIRYTTSTDSEKQKEARGAMISAIIGLFVIISIWGLVRILTRTTGIESGGPFEGEEILPCVVYQNQNPNEPCYKP